MTEEPVKDNGQEMTAEKAQAFLVTQNKLRAEKCTAEIEKILEQHQCQFNAQPFIDDGRILVRVEIVAL